jgi:hypothetical protein
VPPPVVAFLPPMINYRGNGAYESYARFKLSERAQCNRCTTGVEDNGALITAREYTHGAEAGVVIFLRGNLADHSLRIAERLPESPNMPKLGIAK